MYDDMNECLTIKPVLLFYTELCKIIIITF